ncbi:MAG: PepSY domain-containing protein [Clostridiales bacterium]|nr:PepSY domain-containing protein [Clostridiales bacterium]
MNRVKKLFETPKRAVVTVLCMLVIVFGLGLITVYAAGTIAESTAIGTEGAYEIAYNDAGVTSDDIQSIHYEFDFEGGRFVYEIEFTTSNAEYEYVIKASDGTILKKTADIISWESGSATETTTAAETTTSETTTAAEVPATATETTTAREASTASAAATSQAASTSSAAAAEKATGPETTTASPVTTTVRETTTALNLIGIDSAKKIATERAGLTVPDVTFQKAKLDYDDGRVVYEIEFCYGGMEYEVEIDGLTGTVLDYDCEWD